MADESGNGNEGNEGSSIILKDNEGKETTYKASDIETLLSKNSELSGKVAGADGLNKALERYGTDQETYLSNAEAAFGVMSDLIEKGLIDEQGKVVEQQQTNKDKEQKEDNKGDQNFEEMFGFSASGNQKNPTSSEKAMQIISKVVDTKLGGLVKQVEELSSGQAGLFRAQLKSAVQGKYSSLNDNDVSTLFGVASANPAKDLWAHAEEMAKEKENNSKDTRAQYAKEFGVNLEAFDANKLNEQDSKGGGTIAALKGKKFIFPRRAKRLGVKDSVSPREAMSLHLKANANR